MTNEPHRASLWAWVFTPKRALSLETGLDRPTATRLARQARRRYKARIAAVAAVQIATMIGWIFLIDRFVGIYESTVTMARDGSLAGETATGPFGTTVYPLLLGVLVGPFMALVLGAIVGFTAHYLLIDRETRRCARLPACFHCAYDLSAVVGGRCPECGQDQPHLTRTVTP